MWPWGRRTRNNNLWPNHRNQPERMKRAENYGKKKQFMQSNLFLKLKIGALVHKIQYQKKDTPPALYDLVQPALAVHNYNTRYAANQNLCRSFSRTNYGPAKFSAVASQTWEATSMKIKCLPLNSFKKEYKLFLLDSQASWTTLICYLALFIKLFNLNSFLTVLYNLHPLVTALWQ